MFLLKPSEVVYTTQNSKKRCKLFQFPIEGNWSFNTLNMIAYSGGVVNQGAHFHGQYEECPRGTEKLLSFEYSRVKIRLVRHKN